MSGRVRESGIAIVCTTLLLNENNNVGHVFYLNFIVFSTVYGIHVKVNSFCFTLQKVLLVSLLVQVRLSSAPRSHRYTSI